MGKDKIEITVNKDGMVSFHDYIEMKIKYEEHYKKKDKVINDLLSRIAKLEYEVERQDNIINELEKYLIEYFKKEYPDRKLEDYNLENCTYDYALVILGKLQELKGSDKE